jgi:hypothetical protein
MDGEIEAIRERLARIAAEIDTVASELAALDPRSPAPAVLRRWRTEIALTARELPASGSAR